MKSKILSVFAFAACLLTGFTSCSDNDDYTTPSQDGNTQTDVADYTVIYWGSAGSNERSVLNDMTNLVVMREEGKINNKVNLVGCLDPTMNYSKALADKNLGGTIEFELGIKRNTGADTLSVFKNGVVEANGDQTTSQNKDKSIVHPEYLELYSKVFSSMKSCKANSNYNLYDSESLARFITEAAKEHPAKNYVLVFYGHGVGYLPCNGFDGNKESVASRSCVFSTDGSNRQLSLNDVTSAITNSRVKIKTVFYQCCQMAALENFASMQNVTDYVIASAEPTLSGYFPQFMTYLSEVGGTDEGLKTACKKAVDFYATDCLSNDGNTNLSSQGFYDLSYTNTLLKNVSKAATWFASAAKTNPRFMNDVVFGSVEVKSNELTVFDKSFTYSNAHELQKLFNKTLSGGKLTLEHSELLSVLVNDVYNANKFSIFGVCFASMMEAALSQDLAAEAEGLNTDELRNIYNDYLSTLKQMAYIRCNGTEAYDAAYRYASPSVNLFSMNEQGYHYNILKYVTSKEGMLEFEKILKDPLAANDNEGAFKAFEKTVGGTLLANLTPSLSDVKATYQATDFDKATGWSKVLENVNCNPLLLVNPTRYDIINK